jgi:hypothetical protein
MAKNISAQSGGLLDYAIYTVAFIFVAAFLVSLKRPILVGRYLSIFLPLIVSILPLAVFYITRYFKFDMPIRFISVFAAMMLMQFSYGFKLFGGGNHDIYKEAQEYICADITAHSLKAAEICTWDISYYGDEEIPAFAHGENYDVVYINFADEESVFKELAGAGLDKSKVLKIRTTNKTHFIWKKYLR